MNYHLIKRKLFSKTTFILCSVLIIVFSKTQAQNIQNQGVASYYADKFVGRTTASGAKYVHNKLTAAHKTLAFGTKVKVTNMSNNKSVIVVINDRGPFVIGRIIDLSKLAAKKLDFIKEGVTKVEIKVLKS